MIYLFLCINTSLISILYTRVRMYLQDDIVSKGLLDIWFSENNVFDDSTWRIWYVPTTCDTYYAHASRDLLWDKICFISLPMKLLSLVLTNVYAAKLNERWAVDDGLLLMRLVGKQLFNVINLILCYELFYKNYLNNSTEYRLEYVSTHTSIN